MPKIPNGTTVTVEGYGGFATVMASDFCGYAFGDERLPIFKYAVQFGQQHKTSKPHEFTGSRLTICEHQRLVDNFDVQTEGRIVKVPCTSASQYNNHLGDLMANVDRPRTKARMAHLNYIFATADMAYWSEGVDYKNTAEDTKGETADWYLTIKSNNEDGWGLPDDEAATLAQIHGVEAKQIKDKQKCEVRIDIDVVELGVMRFWEYCFGARDICGRPEGHPDFNPDKAAPLGEDHYFRQFLIQDLTNGVDGDSDSDVCDTIIQLGLFDEVVYA